MYLRVRVCECVCNCFEGQITQNHPQQAEKHNICNSISMYAVCILNGAKVITKTLTSATVWGGWVVRGVERGACVE